jgi:hypothetical protein
MAKQQVHEAMLTIKRPLSLRQYEHGGVEFELRANQKHLGVVTFSGAHVYFRHGRSNEKSWDFTKFVEMLKNSP